MAEILLLRCDDRAGNETFGTSAISVEASCFRQIEGDSNGRRTMPMGKRKQRQARARLHVRRIHDGKAASAEAELNK